MACKMDQNRITIRILSQTQDSTSKELTVLNLLAALPNDGSSPQTAYEIVKQESVVIIDLNPIKTMENEQQSSGTLNCY